MKNVARKQLNVIPFPSRTPVDDPRSYIAHDDVIDLNGWLTGGELGYMFHYDPNTGEVRIAGPSGETAWIIQRVKGKEAA